MSVGPLKANPTLLRFQDLGVFKIWA